MLEAEIDEYLCYEKHSSEGDNSGNSRKVITKRKFKAKWEKQKSGYPGIVTASLNQSSSVSTRPKQKSWNSGS